MGDLLLSRRSFLIGCSLAASPLLTPVSFAAAPGENRLVVMVLRGGMDGLDVVRPLGDSDYAALRPTLLTDSASLDLDGFFGLNPGAAGLMPLWQAGELGFAHAVATPYRQQRSHFVGQDLLESGALAADAPVDGGWLNRAVGRIRGAAPDMAVAVGREPMLILEGDAPARQWLPVADSTLSGQGTALLGCLHAADPDFAEAYLKAVALRAESEAQRISNADAKRDQLGAYVAARLNAEARIAAFSFGGWDTHNKQGPGIARRLGDLADTILALKAGLGANWATTLVLAVTEFGRSARENGSAGTDHGTGGASLLAGGALRGKRVLGQWPGLNESALYARRDLMPTTDLRAYAGWALHDLFGLATSDIEGHVFPALDMGPNPQLLR
ncbi:DUF1501 domain-containing protein [Rhodobacter ferrooxidans]|uniref:Twin-arginine translocation pathway signal n=1 Tax=Rhodobacter ferrooxidans TaxID=371731 RepID=C8RX11_9RHOB|nr:DUF1501 domain-containing protein [Rhodobacter sp. SW2]EEW26536.1 protein of unknown function DUF1501 [Rhodobacter sp. SW2]